VHVSHICASLLTRLECLIPKLIFLCALVLRILTVEHACYHMCVLFSASYVAAVLISSLRILTLFLHTSNMYVCTRAHVQIDDAQLQKILKLCDSGKRDGAKCVLGGSRYITNDTKKGFYMQPTIFTDVTDNMEVCTLVQSVLKKPNNM
jgi:Aldehyde dehydrogenase family